MLYAIEKATRQKIEQLVLPTTETVNNKRIADFKQKISDTLALGELAFMQGLVEQYQQEHDVPAIDIAAALAKMSIGDQPMLLSPDNDRPKRKFDQSKAGKERDKSSHGQKRRDATSREPDADKERYRIEVGHTHGMKPGNIVGAIANEAGLDGEHIGHIEIDTDFSLIDLPVGMPKDIFMDLKKVRVCGVPLRISRLGETKRSRVPKGAKRMPKASKRTPEAKKRKKPVR
jgi:ATP-dependent RNA helicase DeaD